MSWRHALMVLGGSAEELCGLLYGEELLGVDNIAVDRIGQYAMDPEQQVAAMRARGWPNAVWHTHPGGRRGPSSIDLDTHPAQVPMVIATRGWIGTWLGDRQVQEALMGQTNDVGEVFEGRNGQWYWRVVAPNGRVIAGGEEGYSNKQHATRAMYRERPELEPEPPQPTAGGSIGDNVQPPAPGAAGGTPSGPPATPTP